MSARALTMADFEGTVTAPGTVIVDFWAAWCGPCRMFAPTFEAASQKHEEVVFAKVDTEANQDLAAALQISSIPTIMVFRDGIRLFSQAGVLPAAALDDLLEQALALDMDLVRAEIASTAASG